jgi:hypothetical protein
MFWWTSPPSKTFCVSVFNLEIARVDDTRGVRDADALACL